MISVRTFVATDAESVQDIMSSCTGELRAVYAPKPQAVIASVNHESPGSRVVAVDRTGLLVGVAEYFARPLALYVQGVAVAPMHRRRGAAGALLAHIATLAIDLSLPALQVATIKETGNVEVFKRLGFSVIEEQTSERFLGQQGQPVTEVTLERYVAIIRRALPTDAESIGEIRVRAWREAYQPFMPAPFLDALDPKQNLDSLKSLLQSDQPELLVKVAESANGVSAFSLLGKPRFEAPAGTIELWALNVDPRSWRQGLGRALVHQALADAKILGAAKLELWCIVGNQSACSLYEACGFTTTGQTRNTSSLTGHPIHEELYEKML